MSLYRPSDRTFYLRYSQTGQYHERTIHLAYALPGDKPVVGDWDGDGYTNVGVYRPSSAQFLLTTSEAAVVCAPDHDITYGNLNALPLVGKWTAGAAADSIGVWQDGVFAFRQSLTDASTTHKTYGNAADTPLVGNWAGDGVDRPAVWRDGQGMFYLDNNNVTQTVLFGSPGDAPLAGDWDGDGIDGVGVRREGLLYLTNTLSGVGEVYQTAFYGLPSDVAVVGVWRELSAGEVPPPVGCAVATPTPTLFIISTTATPSGTITSTPTPLPLIWSSPNLLEQPQAKLPKMTTNPSANLCVTGSSDGDARRACAIRAYNAVWDHLNALGQPLTWNSFFAITLQGEVGILFETGLNYEQCGNPVGVIFNGNNGCQPFVANDLLAALDRALIRQIVEVCRQDGVLSCTENEMVNFLGGLPVPAAQQKYGVEAWYNAGRTSITDPSPNLTKLLGINLTQYQTKVNRLMEWTSPSQISEFKLDEGCGSFACSWGNCTNLSLNRTSLYWVIYFGTGDYSVNGRIQFIIGKPIPVNGQEQICR